MRFARIGAPLAVLFTALVSESCDGADPTEPLDPVVIVTESLTEAIEGQGYSQHLEASGGSGGYSWLLAAGSLPAGLTLAPAGAISGTPVAAGTASFRVRATDSEGGTATVDLSIAVVQALAVHTLSLSDAVVGEEYAAQLQAVGGRGMYTWSIAGGDAGSWLGISSGGELTGTPLVAGPSTVTVAVEDESGQESTRELQVVTFEPLAVAAMTLPTATQGRAYAAQLVAKGGDGAYTWSLESGALPPGLSLAGGGALTGVPEDGGSFTFTARVTDGAGRVATRSLSLTVERAPTIRTTSLPPADVGVAYEVELSATGGTGAYDWSLTHGTLPEGLTLSAAGLISGMTSAVGSLTFTVRVMDEAARSHEVTLTIVVAEIEMLASGVAVTGLAGAAGSVRYYGVEVPSGTTHLSISISGGTGDADLYIRHGSLPEEFVYDCRPLREGNQETCTVTSPATGHWYVMIRGFAAYDGVTLVATHDG